MGPIMQRHYEFKCMPIAASGASTSLTGSTLRRSCHQNSSFSYPFRKHETNLLVLSPFSDHNSMFCFQHKWRQYRSALRADHGVQAGILASLGLRILATHKWVVVVHAKLYIPGSQRKYPLLFHGEVPVLTILQSRWSYYLVRQKKIAFFSVLVAKLVMSVCFTGLLTMVINNHRFVHN